MMESQMNSYLEKINQVIENGKYKADWQSLAEYPVAQWYKEAKFGIMSRRTIWIRQWRTGWKII